MSSVLWKRLLSLYFTDVNPADYSQGIFKWNVYMSKILTCNNRYNNRGTEVGSIRSRIDALSNGMVGEKGERNSCEKMFPRTDDI